MTHREWKEAAYRAARGQQPEALTLGYLSSESLPAVASRTVQTLQTKDRTVRRPPTRISSTSSKRSPTSTNVRPRLRAPRLGAQRQQQLCDVHGFQLRRHVRSQFGVCVFLSTPGVTSQPTAGSLEQCEKHAHMPLHLSAEASVADEGADRALFASVCLSDVMFGEPELKGEAVSRTCK